MHDGAEDHPDEGRSRDGPFRREDTQNGRFRIAARLESRRIPPRGGAGAVARPVGDGARRPAGRGHQGPDLSARAAGRLGRGARRPARPDPGRHRAGDQRGPRASPAGDGPRLRARPHLRGPRRLRRDPRPDAGLVRREGPAPRPAPEGLPPYLVSLYEAPLLLSRAGGAPVPQDELPEVPGRPAPRPDRPRRRRGRPTSTSSRGSARRLWRSRTRSSGRTCGWSSRSPRGTSAPRTTSSSWSATATCR